MNITLAELGSDGRPLAEQNFSKGYVLFGRDSAECDIVFDSTRFPMVSRKHAEVRWNGKDWTLSDLNSSYGVFLNGQKLTAPVRLTANSVIQFGINGPLVKVIWFESVSDSLNVKPFVEKHSDPQPIKPPATPVSGKPLHKTELPGSVNTSGEAFIEFTGNDPRKPFAITTNSVWLGRDPDCSIVFASSSATVSRRHAEIKIVGSELQIIDNNSFNGTLVNGQRITTSVPLYNNDEIQLGIGGPVLRLNSPGRIAPAGAGLAGQRVIPEAQSVFGAEVSAKNKTVVIKLGDAVSSKQQNSGEPQLMLSMAFGEKNELKIGRSESNDITLDGLQISNKHARLIRSGNEISIEDLNSTNGVDINGSRISKHKINPADRVQIGTFLLKVDDAGVVNVFDTRAKTRIDVLNLTQEVKNRRGSGRVKLLDAVSLSIQPNEFIGLLGPSGAGKSTLIDAMNGMRPANSGNVLINDIDLYRHLDTLKHSIGYVPQDDIIHRELSVQRTLFYVAKLRLSRDVSRREIDQIIDEVLDVTGLTESRKLPISQLSGGQRKRVSIAVELITKPSVIYLDEPTSGLDPATEDKIMQLFRQIAHSGRTVIMTTHAMENVKMFDKIVVLMRGKLVFYGKPQDALKYFNVTSFKELYAKLEAPAKKELAANAGADLVRSTENAAENWRQEFIRTPQYQQHIHQPLSSLGNIKQAGTSKKRRLGIFGTISQWSTLSRRYLEVLLKDKLNLLILFIQAPAIALMTFLVMGSNEPRDFIYFVLALVAIWFGTSVAAREIIREEQVYRRERMYNLGILPYLGSKLFILGIIVTAQCLMLFVPLKLMDIVGFMGMPGELGGIPQLWAMILTAAVGIAIGLFISAVVRTPFMATSLIPLLLIPQILFSGIVGVPSGISKGVGFMTPAALSFDTMKRFSTLDTLEPEGANSNGPTRGLGLYKYVEDENDKLLAKAKRDLDEYKKVNQPEYDDGGPVNNTLLERLTVPEMHKIPDDRSKFVSFLHPWMNEVVNQALLMLMFCILLIFTLIALRLKDLS